MPEYSDGPASMNIKLLGLPGLVVVAFVVVVTLSLFPLWQAVIGVAALLGVSAVAAALLYWWRSR